MPTKVIVIREDGLPLDGKIIPAGATIELSGPRLDAALRFKEVRKQTKADIEAEEAAEKK